MKRTIKVRVEVASAEDYAAVVHALTSHKAVVESAWTRHEEIKQILKDEYGWDRKFGGGKIDDAIPD